MILQHTKFLSRVFENKTPIFLCYNHIRNASDAKPASKPPPPQQQQTQQSLSDSSQQGPYRPFPFDSYSWPNSAQYWLKEHPSQSAQQDEYPKEEVYLHEIEERMKKYDKKYNLSPEVKKLHNEFGFENQDDRAFVNYGGSISENNQYGLGKKIDPSNYINSEFVAVNRNVIPPVQYMTPEQVRRSRGRFASRREVPPEHPSIFKYWNSYACLGALGAIIITKELYIVGGHDFLDAILMYTVFGGAMSVVGEWYLWWHTLIVQEGYDREWMFMNKTVKTLSNSIDDLTKKPNERKLLTSLMYYRDYLSEKVLQKTLSNHITRIVDSTLKKLQNKISEEALVKKDTETLWKKDALNLTLNYFKSEEVKQSFLNEALQQFNKNNVAKLNNTAKDIKLENNLFEKKYEEFYQQIKQKYINDNLSQGTLSWVFKSSDERNQNIMSKEDKQYEYQNRIKNWQNTHNQVNLPTPSF